MSNRPKASDGWEMVPKCPNCSAPTWLSAFRLAHGPQNEPAASNINLAIRVRMM
jgi:hypothetical protein